MDRGRVDEKEREVEKEERERKEKERRRREKERESRREKERELTEKGGDDRLKKMFSPLYGDSQDFYFDGLFEV